MPSLIIDYRSQGQTIHMSSLTLGTLSLSLFNLYVALVVPVGIQFACCETLMTRFFKESITASYLKLEEWKQIGTIVKTEKPRADTVSADSATNM